MNWYKMLATMLLCCLMAGVVIGQDELDPVDLDGQIAQRIRAKKMAFFTDKLQLTGDEFQKFWPLYEKYEIEQREIRQAYRPSKGFRRMTEKEAEAQVLANFEMEEKMLSLKKAYFQKFKEVVSVRKIAMMGRVERQFKQELLKRLQQRN